MRAATARDGADAMVLYQTYIQFSNHYGCANLQWLNNKLAVVKTAAQDSMLQKQ